jgi:hypothetical protein
MSGRLMSPALLSAALILLLSSPAFSQTEEQNAYCAYVQQQAAAQRTLLLTPAAVGGFIRSNIGNEAQLYWGVSNSLANYSKAKLTMEAATQNCDAYRATIGAALRIQYASNGLEREALRHRAESLQQAIEQLDIILARNLKLVEVKNATQPMLYTVESVRAKLVADRANSQLKAALLYVPDYVNDLPLKQLVLEKQRSESEAQRREAVLNRQSTWDLRLEAGGRRRLSSVLPNSVEPYGEATFIYNIGSHSSNKHIDKAVAAYSDWKKAQEGEVTRNAQILEQQIRQSIAVQEAELQALQQQEEEIDRNLQRIAAIDTPAAFGFANQLDADKIVLRVEIKDVKFRLQQLKDYIEKNF